ncbi:MAG TPA: TIGR03013 family PEP-CTERM/XrtA system glycosyltransferase [Gammaproteobacteria bacterium]|nr:TIGR03013 family PEP-CTERM/XrtA system glycosyltransferase [Gammaproteobacteria bacterium]
MRVFRHHIRLSYVFLALADTLISVAAIYLASFIRFDSERFVGLMMTGWIHERAMVFAPVMLLSLLAMGLYQSRLREQKTDIVIRLATAIIFGAMALMLAFYLLPPVFVGRGVFALALGFSFVGFIINRLIFYRVIGKDALKRRVLVLGAGERAESILSRLRRSSDKRGFLLVGFVPMSDSEDVVSREYRVSTGGSLKEFVEQNDVDEIVIAVDDRRREFPLDELLDCKMDGTEVTDILTFFEREIGKVRLDLLNPSWMIFSDGFAQDTLRETTKRGFDLLAAMILLLLGWPAMLLVALAIFIESGGRGPILYRQTRLGKNGKPFEVLKFRSMKTDAEQDGKAQWAQLNDSRITRVGAFIRKYRLDELPQIFNVLRGEMSFVGPRPERPEFVEDLSNNIPYYTERHRVKPGLSGWAQLCYPYGSSENDAFEKLQYDLYYVKNHSLLLDINILLQTVEVVLFGKGAR